VSAALALSGLGPAGADDEGPAAASAISTDEPYSRVLPAYELAQPVKPAPMARDTAKRPNILLITTDDQTTTDLAHMPLTRRLLGDRGVTLDGISPHPLCCPARAEILTGQYAQNNGVRTNTGTYGGFARLHTKHTIATYLRTAGYQTIFMGKFLNGYARQYQETRMPGWTSWNPTVDGVYQYNNFVVANDGVAVEHRNTYQTDYFTRLAERKITEAARSKRPFFLWQSYVAPHTASKDEQETSRWSPPPPAKRHQANPFTGLPASMSDPSYAEADVSDKPAHIMQRVWRDTDEQGAIALNRDRIGALQAVDEGVRDMVAALRRSGELANTLIIFTSDNGFLLGEHRFLGKILPYEPSLSVPFLIRGPGVPAGVDRPRIGSTIDLAPTIIAAAGARAVLPVDGRNLLPVVRHGSSSWKTLLVQAGPRRAADEPYGWFYRGVRDSRWTYVRYLPTGEIELYDRWNDPYQLENVARDPRFAPVITELERQLQLLEGCSGAACRQDLGPSPRPLPRTG
jgi:arylsulfatase A-like enzyme